MALKNKLLLTGTAPLLIGLFLITQAEFTYNIDSVGVIAPLREWTLARAQDGNLVSSLRDNRTGKLNSYAVTAFQRGNEARFALNPRLYAHPLVRKGDTIATMYTNQFEERLVQLQGELSVEESELRLYSTGQKTEDVQGVASKMALAQEEVETQRRVTQRITELYRDSLVAPQEYEAALNKLRTRELEVQILKSAWQSASTGGKPEQLRFVAAKTDAIKKQIAQIKNGLKDFALLAPITGLAVQKKQAGALSEEILISIADTSGYVLQFPVSYASKQHIYPGQEVEVAVTGTMQKCRGKVTGIDNTAQIVDGQQAFFITAVLPGTRLPVVPGAFLRTTVLGQSLSAGQYVARGFQSVFVY
jgi:hypothetical protein